MTICNGFLELKRQETRLNANFSDAYNNLGVALAQSGRWDEAIPVFNSFRLRRVQQPGGVYQNFGWANYNLGRASGSIMLSEDEKRELREIAVSESLQRESRTMRSNSQAIERASALTS
ncbi:MAG TPA: hypothetical protein VJ646_21100 [Candidatus Binatia bacterium]|nr:hypothetical protein [Candidatus Binatia bacterium]